MSALAANKSKRASFWGGILLAIPAFVFLVGLMYPTGKEFLLSLYLPKDQWYPTDLYYGLQWLILIQFLPIGLVAGLFLQLRAPKVLLRKYRLLLLTETVAILWLIFGQFASCSLMQQIPDLHEERTTPILARLQPGLTVREVLTIILEANAALLPPPQEGWLLETSDYENEHYQQVQEALKRAKAGATVDLGLFKRRHFFAVAPRKNDNSDHHFRRGYVYAPFHDDTYELVVQYDKQGRMSFARYIRKEWRDGLAQCDVLMEVPASDGKEYPHAC